MKRLDVTKSKFIKLLPYGYPGSGKTYLCGTFALDDRTSPVLHVDVAGNPTTLTQLDKIGDVIQLEKLSDLNYIYDWLVKEQPANHPMVNQMGMTPGYKTLIIDCASDIQRYSFKGVMKEDALQIADVPRSPEFGDWRAVLAQMTEISFKFYKLHMHVVLTAWEKTDVDSSSGITRYRPFFTGQSIDTVPGYALSVARMLHKSRLEGKLATALKDETDLKTVMLLQPSRGYDAKDQNGFNVPYIVNPTATKLLDLIGG